MVSSKRLLVVAVVALVVLVPLTGLAILFFPPDFLYSHNSTYSYTTSISVNATVENATVFLPFPAGAAVGDGFESDMWFYDADGDPMTDWDVARVDTERGPMLRVHADRLVGEDRYVLWILDDDGSVLERRDIGADEIPEDMSNKRLVENPTTYSVSWFVVVDDDIDTRYPIGNATFLEPIGDVTDTYCRDGWGETDECATFTSAVSATYDADAPATLTVGEIRFEGWNEWGFWLSNSFNTFETTTTAAVYADDRQGWTVVDGRLHAGMGRYDGPSR